mmetsp:Transcript_24035/g.43455  ORF Transcript_24035/g.43455 Transcript_24035/m.43455 type:complete len:94 (-) Transcript_24035:1519-1800(-)
MFSGACQGIVGVAIRASDASTSDWLSKINDGKCRITLENIYTTLSILDTKIRMKTNRSLRHDNLCFIKVPPITVKIQVFSITRESISEGFNLQ